MEFGIAKENVFRTPDINYKSKRPAFSSVKNSSKRPLKCVKNTIHSKNLNEETDSKDSWSKLEKSHLPVEEIRAEFKSPLRARSYQPETKSLSIWDKMEDEFFTDCWCSDHFDDNDLFVLPEEMCLTKNDIGTFATKWCNIGDVFDNSFLDTSDSEEDELPELFDSLILNDSAEEDRKSYLELLEESFEVPLPNFSADELQ